MSFKQEHSFEGQTILSTSIEFFPTLSLHIVAVFPFLCCLFLDITHPPSERVKEAARVREKFPDRVPIVVEKHSASQLPAIKKKKFLVPAEYSVAQFMLVVRKQLKLEKEHALNLFVKKSPLSANLTMQEVYQEHRDEDGFLFVVYSEEASFGSC